MHKLEDILQSTAAHKSQTKVKNTKGQGMKLTRENCKMTCLSDNNQLKKAPTVEELWDIRSLIKLRIGDSNWVTTHYCKMSTSAQEVGLQEAMFPFSQYS